MLLVEDQPEVLRLASQTLDREGFSVLEAASAAQARELFSHHGGRVDLLLTDVVMPRESGTELAAALLRENPGLTVLFMSGYGGLHGQESFDASQEQAFLQKPFTPEGLLLKVREVLDRSAQFERMTPCRHTSCSSTMRR